MYEGRNHLIPTSSEVIPNTIIMPEYLSSPIRTYLLVGYILMAVELVVLPIHPTIKVHLACVCGVRIQILIKVILVNTISTKFFYYVKIRIIIYLSKSFLKNLCIIVLPPYNTNPIKDNKYSIASVYMITCFILFTFFVFLNCSFEW